MYYCREKQRRFTEYDFRRGVGFTDFARFCPECDKKLSPFDRGRTHYKLDLYESSKAKPSNKQSSDESQDG